MKLILSVLLQMLLKSYGTNESEVDVKALLSDAGMYVYKMINILIYMLGRFGLFMCTYHTRYQYMTFTSTPSHIHFVGIT